MGQREIDRLKRELETERAARKEAEKTHRKKAEQLYEANRKLINANKELEALFTKTDSQLQGVFENIVDAYVIIDLFGNILKMNEAAVSLLGFKDAKEDYNLNHMVAPHETQRVEEAFKKLYNDGAITDFQVDIVTIKKEHKIVHINGSIIYDDGIAVAAQAIVRDITQKKAYEDQLIETKNRLSALILNLESGVLLEDEHRKIVITNKKFCDLMHIPLLPEELSGQDCSKAAEQSKCLFKSPDQFVERIEEIIKSNKPVLGEEVIMADGTVFERNFIPITYGKKNKGHLWKYRDVTSERLHQKSLEAQKQKYHSIISNMNLGLVEINKENRIIMANKSFLEMTGYSEDEIIGLKGGDFLPIEDDKQLIEKKLVERKKGKIGSYEFRIKNKKGEVRYWLSSGAPNYDAEGNVSGSIGVNYDITEIKNLEIQKEKLLEKLEKSNDELQEYAHVVSHDLKSPLRSIYALTSWLKEDNKDKLDAASLQNIELIEHTVEKMDQLITDVLEYSTAETSENENVDVNLNEVIKELILIMYTPEHITIEILNDLPIVKGDKTKLTQLFQNLISNAIKFIDKEKGFIQIDVKELKTHYQFAIKDNGMGIAPQFHEKIFKVFHSLNKDKDSSGIGLSIVKKIVNFHHGEIWLDSTPNLGTTFFFTIKK